jgi:hypothetical protein
MESQDFLLAENVLRNAAHSGWNYASGFPDAAEVLKIAEGNNLQKVVGIQSSQKNSGA